MIGKVHTVNDKGEKGRKTHDDNDDDDEDCGDHDDGYYRDNDHDDDKNDNPFEWLTNFQSLRELLLPSCIVFDRENAVDSPSSLTWPDPSDLHESGCNVTIQLNALHVGCGTSTMGESLLCLKEYFPIEKAVTSSITSTELQSAKSSRTTTMIELMYGTVVNVDIDRHALKVMKQQFHRRLLRAKESNKNESKCKCYDSAGGMGVKDVNIGNIVWKYLDFKNEQSCRKALDPIYRQLMLPSVSKNVSQRFDPLLSSTNQLVERGAVFDLVIDKSTLDCLLCSEPFIIANFFCEVYRALRVPTINTNKSYANHHDMISTHPYCWGGIYVLVTFHPVDFIYNLLANIPGVDWEVEHQVIKRQVEDLSNNGCQNDSLKMDVIVHDYGAIPSSNNEMSKKSQEDEKRQKSKGKHITNNINDDFISSTYSSPWISGTFHPNENYRRTVNVFTCRRRHGAALSSAPSSTDSTTHILCPEQVRSHVEKTCNQWYQSTNPMVTSQREAQIRMSFLEAARKASTPMPASPENKPIGDNDVVHHPALELKECYEILFNEAEREHLTFDYFMEDWDAYCGRRYDHKDVPFDSRNSLDSNTMTVEVALDFLREMQ